jgi:hypothetical protein
MQSGPASDTYTPTGARVLAVHSSPDPPTRAQWGKRLGLQELPLI